MIGFKFEMSKIKGARAGFWDVVEVGDMVANVAAELKQDLQDAAPKKTGESASQIRVPVIGRAGGFEMQVEMPRSLYWTLTGTEPHEIRSSMARSLFFGWGGRDSFFRRVQHPGTQPQSWPFAAIEKAQANLSDALSRYIISRYDMFEAEQ